MGFEWDLGGQKKNVKGACRANRLYQVVLLSLAVIIAGLCVEPIRKMTFAWELDTLTIRQKWYAPKSRASISPISLINLDARTQGNTTYMKVFGRIFSRKAAGYAIRFLNRTQPKAVILDVSFNGGKHQEDVADNRFLIDSIQPGKPVISQFMFEVQGQSANKLANLSPEAWAAIQKNTVRVRGIEQFSVFQKIYTYNSLVPPYTELLNSGMKFYSAASGTFITDLKGRRDDAQGNIRRWGPFSLYEGAIFPTLQLGVLLYGEKNLLLNQEGRLSWRNHHLDLGAEGVPLIKWYGHGVNLGQPVYPEYSFSDVVLSELWLECQEKPALPICKNVTLPAKPALTPEIFKSQYALIGFVMANEDAHQTIYSARYPGVYILANTLDNALHNDFVKPAPDWLNNGLLLLLPLLLAGIILRFQSPLISILLTATLCIGHFMACLYAYHTWNLWIYVIYPILGMLIGFTGLYVYQYTKEQKKRQQMRFAFGKYVSPAVLQIIEQQPEKITLGGERREMTFLFSDIRGFTTFSDQNEPEVVQTFLTQYFSTMNQIIMHNYQGSINKLIGDAIMAYWGFPLTDEDHAFLAVSSAMAMRDAMLDWRKQADKLPINIGIGINTGEAVIGNVGSDDFMDFTVIGDAVNVASRLEGLNKEFGTNLIISRATYEKVKGRIDVRPLGWAELKGKGEQVEVFEPIGFL